MTKYAPGIKWVLNKDSFSILLFPYSICPPEAKMQEAFGLQWPQAHLAIFIFNESLNPTMPHGFGHTSDFLGITLNMLHDF